MDAGPQRSSRTLALVLEYDGSPYHGFQRQHGLPTVAERVENALAQLFGHETKVVAAGRTDRGVHARGQVVSCTTTSAFPLERMALAASALLRPHAIAVVRAAERPEGFSARRDALARCYRYLILNRVAPSPLQRGRVFHVSRGLDAAAMQSAALSLEGEHDFAAFCAAGSDSDRTIRRITAVEVRRQGELVEVSVSADSFLHNMVRIIVGTLVEVGRGTREVDDVEAVLRSRSRSRAGFTAPPHGLYLEKVEYANQV
ncbi:MAG: tRNA pseudouridine(38-40) synthase TruA [Candidatus Eremiobacter antarcticus]|nr:tRNA pseudouridine(38-40) synthase TruA [Candidatus Eremiobacteraeota bacterium]MBC5807959.1 tRNA pseudouridine(38-40) synthase TruA [Candidatus Eremiobacteraeota bacterium]PZR62676.1 MAG: tRNA pseudouridine(38-40) synthase TruA [Candidatus Eremiobacter sp. RRmetagenome_bin22]